MRRPVVHGDHGGWWKLTADVLEIGGGMLNENWRTVPIALLSPVAPFFTLVAQTRDIAYAYSRIFRRMTQWLETGG